MAFSISDLIFRRLDSAYRSGYQIGDQAFLTALADVIAGADPSQASSNPTAPSIAVGTANSGFYTPAVGAIGVSLSGAEQVRFTGGSTSVNRIELTGAATATAVQLAAAGSDTNVSLNITSKGTSNISLRTGGNQQVLIINTTSSTNSIGLTGSTASNAVQIAVQGGTNIPIAMISRGTGALQFATQNNVARIQFQVADTAGTVVNYVQAAGNITANAPIVSAQGTDANINLRIEGKGTGPVDIGRNFANYMSVLGAAAASHPVIQAVGSDTNVDLRLQPKGTGQLDIVGTAATAAVSAPAFSATSRIQIKINGTSFWIPASSASW